MSLHHKNLLIKKVSLFFSLIFVTLCMACTEETVGSEENVSSVEKEIDYDESKEKLDEYCKSFPSSMYFGDEDSYHTFDITGDGYDELITIVYFGSGMPRQDIALYDAHNDKTYHLDCLSFRNEYGYDYGIIGEEDGIFIVYEKDFRKELEPVFGVLTFENDKLGFETFEKDSKENTLARNIYYSGRYERSDKIAGKSPAMFDVGLKKPVCILKDDYIIYGMFDSGYVTDIAILDKDSEYYFWEGKSAFVQISDCGEYKSEKYYEITKNFTSKLIYEVRDFDGTKKLFVGDEEIETAPELYEEYCPIDESCVSLSEILN